MGAAYHMVGAAWIDTKKVLYIYMYLCVCVLSHVVLTLIKT